MEKLIVLGETSRNHTKKSFGTPVLVDEQNRQYQVVEDRYNKLLQKDNSFEFDTMRAFDFKLPRARGLRWPEPPRVDDLLIFNSLLGSESLCSGRVTYIHLGRKRSVGVLYIKEWNWFSKNVPDFTN